MAELLHVLLLGGVFGALAGFPAGWVGARAWAREPDVADLLRRGRATRPAGPAEQAGRDDEAELAGVAKSAGVGDA